jgi:hypothetical protein
MSTQLDQDIRQIKERNQRVEADKAWETSAVRVASIAIITYIVVVVFLYVIDAANIFLSALIPVVGFILSTQSLPILKRWWIKNNLQK